MQPRLDAAELQLATERAMSSAERTRFPTALEALNADLAEEKVSRQEVAKRSAATQMYKMKLQAGQKRQRTEMQVASLETRQAVSMNEKAS